MMGTIAIRTFAAVAVLYLVAVLVLAYIGIGIAIANSNEMTYRRHCPGKLQPGPRWMAGAVRPITIALWPLHVPLLAIEVVYEPQRVCDRWD